MKTLNVRVSDQLAAEIEAESSARRISKSEVMRERLDRGASSGEVPPSYAAIADLAGSVVDDLPSDLSARTKHYLRAWGYGRKRHR